MDYGNIPKFVFGELVRDLSGHNHQHAERVVHNAMKIMEKEGGDAKIVLTAAWLHDCIDKKLYSDVEAQIRKVEQFLDEQGFSPNEIEEVSYIIQNISFNGGENRPLKSLNAMIVRDADRLDALGAIGIIRTIEYGTSKGRAFYEEENLKWVDGKCGWNHSTETTLSHFYDKLLKLEELMHTQTGKELAKKRSAFLSDFLNEFYEEMQ